MSDRSCVSGMGAKKDPVVLKCAPNSLEASGSNKGDGNKTGHTHDAGVLLQAAASAVAAVVA